MSEISIGEFARRSRLSLKALRLYDKRGVLVPSRVDHASGYRYYDTAQLDQARLVVMMRELQLSLKAVKELLACDPADAAKRIDEHWRDAEAAHDARRELADYLVNRLRGKRPVMYEVGTREIPDRSLLCVKRNVAGVDQAWAFGKEFIGLLRQYQLPEIPGRAGGFFCIYWAEVSEDSDGPMEWCRPVPPDEAEALAARCPELTLRAEAAHQEAFVTIGDGQIDGAEWQLVEQSLHAWSEQQRDMRPADLGVRMTYLPSEVGQDSYQDFAIPFNGRPRG